MSLIKIFRRLKLRTSLMFWDQRDIRLGLLGFHDFECEFRLEKIERL